MLTAEKFADDIWIVAPCPSATAFDHSLEHRAPSPEGDGWVAAVAEAEVEDDRLECPRWVSSHRRREGEEDFIEPVEECRVLTSREESPVVRTPSPSRASSPMICTHTPSRAGSPQVLVRPEEVVQPLGASTDGGQVETSRAAWASLVVVAVEVEAVEAAKASCGEEGPSGSSVSARAGGAPGESPSDATVKVAAGKDVDVGVGEENAPTAGVVGAPTPLSLASPAWAIATEGVPGASAVVALADAVVASTMALVSAAKTETSLAGTAENPIVINDSDDDDNRPLM